MFAAGGCLKWLVFERVQPPHLHPPPSDLSSLSIIALWPIVDITTNDSSSELLKVDVV